MSKKKKGNKDIIVIEKNKMESILMILFIVVLTFIGLRLIFGSINTISNLESEKQLLESLNQNPFVDTDVNIILQYPGDWVLSQIDDNILEEKKKVISESSNGKPFNILEDKLTEEVVSLLAVSNPTQLDDGSYTYSQFMSVSFMGDIEGMDKQEKLEGFTERFKENILISNPDDVKNIEIVKSNFTPLGDMYIELNVEFESRTIRYGQYSMVVGKNIATGIMGSNLPEENIYEKLEKVITSIKARQQ